MHPGMGASVELRIDELAQRAGTTSRNIRAYQARGLLPPPVMRGRTGWYGEEHLHRLALISHLQERGFSLAAVRQTLEAWSQGGDLGHLIGFHHLLTAPWTDEEPARVSAAELVQRFADTELDTEAVDQAIALGLLVDEGDGTFTAPSPLLLDAGAELARAGIPLPEILDMVKAVRADVADIADRFIGLVATHLVEPITEAGATPEETREISHTVQRLRAIAMEVVRPFLAQELRRAIDETLVDFGSRLSAEVEDRAEG